MVDGTHLFFIFAPCHLESLDPDPGEADTCKRLPAAASRSTRAHADHCRITRQWAPDSRTADT